MTTKPSDTEAKPADKSEHELPDTELDTVTGGAGMDGISYLVAVTQMKANNANDAALQGAERQRELISEKKKLR